MSLSLLDDRVAMRKKLLKASFLLATIISSLFIGLYVGMILTIYEIEKDYTCVTSKPNQISCEAWIPYQKKVNNFVDF